MIKYQRGFIHAPMRLVQMRGSVFPKAFLAALPCGILTWLLKFCMDKGYTPWLTEEGSKSILADNSCWSGLTFLVGFLIVFRTSQAHSRFWDGCTAVQQMRAEWFDSCANLMAFCKHSTTADPEAVLNFQHIAVRLFSMLHAVALADIEDCQHDSIDGVRAFKYELLDGRGLDAESLKTVKTSPAKVELVFQWIQQLIIENLDNGVLKVPPPILSRAFQEIANGMIAFQEAMKISSIPFPFPYTQTCECLLMFHWFVTPLLVSQYVTTTWWGALFGFLQVFVYWSLNAIAVEIENPFGMDANDLDVSHMQRNLNEHLMLLLDPTTLRTPTLKRPIKRGGKLPDLTQKPKASLIEIWGATCPTAGIGGLPARRASSIRSSTSECSAAALSASAHAGEVSQNSVATFGTDNAFATEGRPNQEDDAPCIDRFPRTSFSESITSGLQRSAEDVLVFDARHWNYEEAGQTVQSESGLIRPHSTSQPGPGTEMMMHSESAALDGWVTQPEEHSLSHTEPPCECELPPKVPLGADLLIWQNSAARPDKAVAGLIKNLSI